MVKHDLIALEMKKREEIINNFDKNYLLEAGAGAGKTTIIVERIINHIMKRDVDPAKLVAITFTKAASTELAERIQLKALEYLKVEDDPKVIERLKAVDRIFTGTIHSFCELILREMPFDANITPDYEIIEDDFEFHNGIWNSFLRDKQKEYKEIIDLLKKFNIDYRELRTKAILALENPDIEFVGYGEVDYSFEDLEGEFERIKEKYGYLSEEAFSKAPNLGKLFGSILQEKDDLGDYVERMLKEFPKSKDNIDDNFDSLILKRFQDTDYSQDYKDLIQGVQGVYEKLNILAYNTCTDFINMVVKYKNQRYQGKLTFNQLLYKASNLIKESQAARSHYKNKYEHFYVDEFQDTDPMQAELILQLTDSGDSKPRPGSLFVVGDPKQSIYRFRRANIAIYNRVKEIIGNNGEVVYLDINFRSSDEICNWVESTFKDHEGFGFQEEATDVQAGFSKILSLWDDSQDLQDENHLRGIYKYLYPEKEDQEYVANIVEDILENHYILEKKRIENIEEVSGEKDHINIKRKVKFADIMILTKANAETGLYLRALKDRGISALLAGEKQLGDTREVLNLYILIDALIDYRDDIKIVSALRNAFNIDLDTIDLFMEENKNLSQFIFYGEEIEKIQHPSVKEAFTHLNNMARLSRQYSPLAFVEKLIENRLGIYDIHKKYVKLELRDAESALKQTMEILKSRNCGSVYEIREELKNLVSTPVNYELPISKDESENAIRIMNIHKAKGLEANIVILVGGQKIRNTFGDTHFVDKNEDSGNIGYMVYKSDHGTLGPREEERKAEERDYKEAEIDRLLYVAATRAKSGLIIADGEGKNLFLNPLVRNIERELSSEREIVDRLVDEELSYEKKRELEITKDLRIKKDICKPSYMKTTPSNFQLAENNHRKIGKAFRSPNYRRFEMYFPPRKIQTYKGPRGNIYGIIVHRAMEILINKSQGLKNTNEDILEYAIRLAIDESMDNFQMNVTNIRLLYSPMKSKLVEILDLIAKGDNEKAKAIIKKRLTRYVRKVLENFINNEHIIEIFEGAEDIFTEVPFTIAIRSGDIEALERLSKFIPVEDMTRVKVENKPILINGVVDLLVKSIHGSWIILDYKTDVPYKEDIGLKLRKSYRSQLEGYKILFEEIMKGEEFKVEDMFFYSTVEDRVINAYD